MTVRDQFTNEDPQFDAHAQAHKEVAEAINTALEYLKNGALPAGGKTGDALRKKTADTGNVEWAPVRELPSGGQSGQTVVKGDSPLAFKWAKQNITVGVGGIAGWLKTATKAPDASTTGAEGTVLLVFGGKKLTNGQPPEYETDEVL